LPPPEIEPRSPGRPVRKQTLYCLSYSGSLVCTINGKKLERTESVKDINVFIIMCIHVHITNIFNDAYNRLDLIMTNSNISMM
jgi:hypothetical protein